LLRVVDRFSHYGRGLGKPISQYEITIPRTGQRKALKGKGRFSAQMICGIGRIENPSQPPRRTVLSMLPALGIMSGAFVPVAAEAQPAAGILPSWNDGPAKQAIADFVHIATDSTRPDFVPPAKRIATFDQDGTLWVEQPMYSQVIYCLDRVPTLVKARLAAFLPVLHFLHVRVRQLASA
jgi:hypothetical protein